MSNPFERLRRLMSLMRLAVLTNLLVKWADGTDTKVVVIYETPSDVVLESACSDSVDRSFIYRTSSAVNDLIEDYEAGHPGSSKSMRTEVSDYDAYISNLISNSVSTAHLN